MLAEIKESTVKGELKPPGIQSITSTVEVSANHPVFSFPGLEQGKNATIDHERADFKLSLKNPPTGFLEGSRITFVQLVPPPPQPQPQPPTDGPIAWRHPGTEQAVARPDYIDRPTLQDDTTLTFSLTNTSHLQQDVVIGFVINVLLTVPGRPDQVLTSPDPTIINVDPPDA